MIDVFKKTMPVLERGLLTIEAEVEEPHFVDNSDYPRFRHNEKTIGLAVYLKAVRIVSALNANLLLLESGFTQETSILFRTIDEFFEDIIFLLSPQADGGLSEAQIQFLEEFYQEEFNDPTKPFTSEQKRNRVPRRKVYAALGKATDEFVNPSDGTELHRTLSQTMSGFVHGAYPHIMELYGGKPPHYHLDGMLDTPTHYSCIMQARNYYYRGIQALILLSQAFQCEALTNELLDIRSEFEESVTLERAGDIAKQIRDLKKGRN